MAIPHMSRTDVFDVLRNKNVSGTQKALLFDEPEKFCFSCGLRSCVSSPNDHEN
jgi:hypothetical protein